MKNNFFMLLCFCVNSFLFSQVGINTSSPETTFEVVGKAEDINHYDGILPPRITGDQLQKKTYNYSKKGAVIFVTIAPSNLSGQVADITEPGLYYFSGYSWKSISNQKEPIEYRIILSFDNSNDDVLTESSKWSEPLNLSSDKNVYLTSSKHYSIGTKKYGGFKGSVTLRKLEGIVNIKFEISRASDAPNVLDDVLFDISGICNEIGYFPKDIVFMQNENSTYVIPVLLQNNTIYIIAGNLNMINSNATGEVQGYSNWIKPHSK